MVHVADGGKPDMDATSLLAGTHIVPVVVIEDEATVTPLAEVLLTSGIRAIEITLRSSPALAAIERVALTVPELIVGAGSVREPGQFRQIADAGAQFAVSPGSSERLLAAARENALPFVPGAVTASEIIRLLEHGYRLQKFFPAELSGGLAQLRALAAPLPEVRFFPTGGITLALARDYLAFDRVSCIGGSWFVPEVALRERDFVKVRRLATEAVTVAEQARQRLAGSD
jgi:2-dehydro-3-deoxyphosphogluconate aldolase/(4S)-4-hydroxy-2-oxoglutarate aldolase